MTEVKVPEMLFAYRFGLYVDGNGPIGVSQVGELRKNILEDGVTKVEDFHVEAGIYARKPPGETLLKMFAIPAEGMMLDGVRERRFQLEIYDYFGVGENRIVGAIWKLEDVQLLSYSLSGHDAMVNGILMEKVVLRPRDFSLVELGNGQE